MKFCNLPLKVQKTCNAFVAGLSGILGANLYGIYMYGAAVFPDAGPIQDVDCHVVLREGLNAANRKAIHELYHVLSNQFPRLGQEIDAYLILYCDAQSTNPPSHQLKPEIRDDSWALHCAHIRAGRYLNLFGPDPNEIFPSPSWDAISSALNHEIKFITKNLKYPAYCVLNMCRIVYSFQTKDVVVSKNFSSKWAAARFPQWESLIAVARKSYEIGETEIEKDLIRKTVPEFLTFSIEQIRNANLNHEENP